MRTVTHVLLLVGLLCWALILEAAALPQHLPHSQYARNQAGSVFLTFDDGPSAYTPQVLQVLQQYGAPATFFCVGSQVQTDPAPVRQSSQAGNVIGNHSWSHSDLTTLSPAAIEEQLQSTSVAIQQATGTSPTLFRPPYGATNATVRSVASQLGLTQILWSIDTRDWQRPGVAAIVNTALQAQNGSIILLHDGGGDRAQTVAALPQIISELRQRGFTFATL